MGKSFDADFMFCFGVDKIQAIKDKCKSEHIWYEDFVEDLRKKYMVMDMHMRTQDFMIFINAMADKFIETGSVYGE